MRVMANCCCLCPLCLPYCPAWMVHHTQVVDTNHCRNEGRLGKRCTVEEAEQRGTLLRSGAGLQTRWQYRSGPHQVIIRVHTSNHRDLAIILSFVGEKQRIPMGVPRASSVVGAYTLTMYVHICIDADVDAYNI